jgi:hypothetical protein
LGVYLQPGVYFVFYQGTYAARFYRERRAQPLPGFYVDVVFYPAPPRFGQGREERDASKTFYV